MTKESTIPPQLKESVLARLAAHGHRYIVYGVEEVIGQFRGPYLYVSYVEESVGLPIQRRPSPLCRLRYTGDPEYWEFQIYKYSDESYDDEGEFPFPGGTVEECFDAAASLYIAECFPDLKPDLPSDQELIEYERGCGRLDEVFGWELQDGTLLPGPGMVRYLMNQLLDEWREDVEAKPIRLNTTLQAALNKQPSVWIEAISQALGLTDATTKKERVKAIVAQLPRRGTLREIVEHLPFESRQALQCVMERGGWVEYNQLTRQFGSEEGDGWFWNEQPPTSVLGVLRLHGLLFVGQANIKGRRWKVAVIPKDLRPVLTEMWPDRASSRAG